MKKIDLKSCLNVRDIGGHAGAGGRTARTGRLIRSAKTDALSPEDARILKERVGVTTIIDLRTEKEVREEPDVTFGCDYYNIPIRPDVREGVKYKFPSSLKSYASRFPSMPQMYANMLTTEFSTGQLRKIFAIIFDVVKNDGCVLFHCTEGKDRTGIVAALCELLLGVDRDEIMTDYLRSNECFEKRNRRYYRLTVIAFMDVGYAGEFRKMYEAHPSMLLNLFDIVDGAGGADGYFTGRLGFEQAEIDAFRNKMLVDPAAGADSP